MQTFPDPASEAAANRIMLDATKQAIREMIEDGRLPEDTDVDAMAADIAASEATEDDGDDEA